MLRNLGLEQVEQHVPDGVRDQDRRRPGIFAER